MNLPDTLAKLRDEDADNYHDDNVAGTFVWKKVDAIKAYKSGFDAGAEAMRNHIQTETDKLETALQKLRDTIEFGPFFGTEATNCVQEADKTLASYRAWKEKNVNSKS